MPFRSTPPWCCRPCRRYERFCGAATIRRTSALGTALVKQGEPPDALYVLVSGAVEVTAWHPEGPALLRRLEATDYFGEIGLLRGRPRTSTVTALGQCSLWRIPAEAFLAGVAEAGESGALSDTIRVRYATQPVLQPR